MLNSTGKLENRTERGFLAKDVRNMNEFLRQQGRSDDFLALAEPSFIHTLTAVLINWAWIFASIALVYFHSLWWLPLAMLVIGSRQRALVVLTHEASHYLLAKERITNDRVANLFLCFPMVKSLKSYRATHLPHHINLGDERNDTDRLHDPEMAQKGWFKVYLKYLFSSDQWCIAEWKQMFGHISRRHKLLLAVWWGVVLSGLSIVVGSGFAATFFCLWFLSRITAYHIITTFIIISDHHGLFPGTIVGYTRNHPHKGLMRWFIHPHNNGLHLTHHLAPFVPFYNLNKARKLLKGWNSFDSAEQCETYFFGKNSVVRSWGKCVAPATPNLEPAFAALQAVLQDDRNMAFKPTTGSQTSDAA